MYKHLDSLVCEVFDNGKEIHSDKIDELNRKLTSQWNIDDNKHIGLNNINSRIKLLWGDSYGCHIVSDSEGATVTVKIPLIEN